MSDGMMGYIRDWKPPRMDVAVSAKESKFINDIFALYSSFPVCKSGWMYEEETDTLHWFDLEAGVVPEYVRRRLEELT